MSSTDPVHYSTAPGVQDMWALVVSDEVRQPTAAGRATRDLITDLESRGVNVLSAVSAEDAAAIVLSNPRVQAVILDWDLHRDHEHLKAASLLATVRRQNTAVPVFVLAERSTAALIPAPSMMQVDDFIWLLEDTPDFISGRILAAIRRYQAQLLPPMFRALVNFAATYEYSWHTPGHTGGTAFLKSPVGRAFFDFFGESLFRSDLSVSVGALGSLLDHSGPIGEGERYAAQVFGADRTYYVTNGTSTSNRVVVGASVARGQIVLCDRNCHKSTEHAITLAGAVPVYMMPHRNHLGLIGPIPPAALTREAIQQAIAGSPLAAKAVDTSPAHAILTNSTYDGLCYNVARVEELLGESVDSLHFDEAWYAYARFNPLYRGRFAMHGDPASRPAEGPTVYATQSTHKLLAALSQASMIHVREGRRTIGHERFNEAFMMHASTSPQYAIIASNDVSAAMMDGNGGQLLTTEAIREAISFRQMMARLRAEFSQKEDWFFDVWQPVEVREEKAGRWLAFEAAPEAMLVEFPDCWMLDPDASWHGFRGLEPDYCMLDPIKVSVVTPGLSSNGQLRPVGIPAQLVSAYLADRGIIAEKTANFTVLFLFSMGITKGKWGALVSGLLEFKRDYDANMRLERAVPSVFATDPDRFRNAGLRDVSTAVFETVKAQRLPQRLEAAFGTLPKAASTPAEAYDRLVRAECHTGTLDSLADNVIATGIVPYPPGIPLLMPGEEIGSADGPILSYLRALEAFDQAFPAFAHDIHGIESKTGTYHALQLTGRSNPR